MSPGMSAKENLVKIDLITSQEDTSESFAKKMKTKANSRNDPILLSAVRILSNASFDF